MLLPAVGAVELAWTYFLRTFEPENSRATDRAGWEISYRQAVRALG